MSADLLHHAIGRAAERAPDHEAVRCTGAALTYGALDERSDRLAHVLAASGVRRGDRVGLYLARGVDATVGIYGILKAGAAYVPLDPTAPTARIAFILDDCGIRVVVTEPAKAGKLADLAASGVTLDACIGAEAADELPGPAIPWSEVNEAPAMAPEAGLSDDDLAYVLYTSGSTGVPKGVTHTHRSARAWATVSASTYGFRPEDRISSHAPLHFDLSTLDYFATAEAGATIVVIPELYTKMPASLSGLMEAEGLTVLYVVPLALTHLLTRGALDKRDLSALRWVLFGGDPLAPQTLRALMRAWPHARFSNVYGPTEVNGVTYHVLPEAYARGIGDEPIPIGGLYDHVNAQVVDEAGETVASGEVGELLIQAPTMMKGYWGRPDLDERAFYRHPASGDVFHRTGDLVRESPEGLYHFLGRKDRQIKARGHRVELEEVEAVLSAHPAVTAAAAFPMTDHEGTIRIEAAVVPTPEAEVSEADLRTYAASRLSPYAIPEAFGILDRFPQTSSGKIDRLALQAQAASLSSP